MALTSPSTLLRRLASTVGDQIKSYVDSNGYHVQAVALELDDETNVGALNPLPTSHIDTLAGVTARGLLTNFDEVIQAGRYTDYYANSAWGLSDLRDEVAVANTGAVTASDGELRIATGADPNSTASLRSLARASYVAGSQGQVGVGIRVPTAAAGDQEARWGLFDDDNGFGFGQDATGPFVFTRADGVETIVSDEWSVDAADGDGVSGRTLDFSEGIICHIDFVYYGYGPITYSVFLPDDSGNGSVRVPIHEFTPVGGLSVVDPNQPVSVEVLNGAGDSLVAVGGRQLLAVPPGSFGA